MLEFEARAPKIVIAAWGIFSGVIVLCCWVLFKICCCRTTELLAEGEVEQDGMSSVSPDWVPPAANKEFPSVERRVLGVDGMTAAGSSGSKICCWGGVWSLCCD